MGRSQHVRTRTSGDIARIRLEQTIASDYLECSAQQFQNMQKEILEILSRYININDTKEIRLKLAWELKQGVPYVKTIQIKGL